MLKTLFCFLLFISSPILAAHEEGRQRLQTKEVCAPYVQNNAWKFRYGKHFPNGQQAVDFAYSPEGTWRKITNIEYKWNYYPQYATPAHPFGKKELLEYAEFSETPHQTTCRDANGHLLLDFLVDGKHDGEINNNGAGHSAFIEHSGRGDTTVGKSFNQFWFDDNYLARFMSHAYGKEEPYGLSEYDDFVRWAIIGGVTKNWTPYSDENFDQLALNGLYYLANGDAKHATKMWKRALELSGAQYNKENQEFDYPNIHENYHMGLIKIFAEHLLDLGQENCADKSKILQHTVSLRSHILKNQKKNAGWTSNIGINNSLMNTESITIGALALGAMAHNTYEPGQVPMRIGEGNYFLRPYATLSAVTGKSTAGLLQSGPGAVFSPGKQHVDFFLRAPLPCAETAKLEIRDIDSDKVLSSKDVSSNDMTTSNQWTKITVPIEIKEAHRLDFRIYWPGNCNLDVGPTRIR